MSYDLGMPLGFYTSRNIQSKQQEIKKYINYLQDKIDFVIIVEYFDLSMVLLKRLLKWSFLDLIYIKRHVNRQKISRSYHRESDEKIHKEWSKADYMLYDAFNKTFWRKVSEEKSVFEELRFYKEILKNITNFCKRAFYRKTLNIKKSRWSEKMVMDRSSCMKISKNYDHKHIEEYNHERNLTFNKRIKKAPFQTRYHC